MKPINVFIYPMKAYRQRTKSEFVKTCIARYKKAIIVLLFQAVICKSMTPFTS